MACNGLFICNVFFSPTDTGKKGPKFCKQEVQPEWQTAASSVLVAVGMKYCNEVMADLHEKFQPGVLPHFFVVQTMANLSVANGKVGLLAFGSTKIFGVFEGV